jgi:hypothetical protein
VSLKLPESSGLAKAGNGIALPYIIMEQVEPKSGKFVLDISVINSAVMYKICIICFVGAVLVTIRHSSVLPDKHIF